MKIRCRLGIHKPATLRKPIIVYHRGIPKATTAFVEGCEDCFHTSNRWYIRSVGFKDIEEVNTLLHNPNWRRRY
jgi:hypothetical protein